MYQIQYFILDFTGIDTLRSYTWCTHVSRFIAQILKIQDWNRLDCDAILQLTSIFTVWQVRERKNVVQSHIAAVDAR